MSTAPNLRTRDRSRSAKTVPSFFADGRPAWHFAIDCGALVVLLFLGVLGFSLSFGGDPRYLIAGLGGILLGLGIAVLNARLRLGLLITTALAFGAYMLFGSALAVADTAVLGFLPSLDSLRTLLLGIVFAWKDMLTVGVPVGTANGMLIVPFLSSLITALAAGLLAWRLKSPYWPLLPVLALFVTGIAFSTSAGFLNVERGVSLTIIAIVWATFRHDALRQSSTKTVSANRTDHDAGAARRGKLRRLGTGAAVIAAAVAITAVASPLVTASDDRKVLRNTIVPPFDPRDYVTPLASFRNFVKDQKDSTLFSVKGLPKDGRVRLAALDSFNGLNYTMDPNSSGNFSKVGDARSLNTLADTGSPVASTNYSLDITIEDYQGYFVPGGRHTTGLSFAEAAGAASGLYFNAGTDTAVTTQGLGKGDSYTVQVSDPGKLEHGQLTQYDFAKITLPDAQEVPPIVASQANELSADAPTAIDRVRQIEAHFQKSGAFSNGLVAEGQLPSLPGHSAARVRNLLSAKQMLGDDEQYSVAMSLMLRHLGIPSRVVMGFYPDPKSPENGAGDIKITGKDVHAWVEVAFDRVGWVAFDPTPPKDNVPIPPDPESKSKPKPQVLQPPPPPQEPADLPPDSTPDALDADEKKNNPWLFWGPLLAAIGVALIPLGILAIPLLLILLLKARRRKARFRDGHPAQRVGGGWNEVLSLATDMGASIDNKSTRRESASVIADAFPVAGSTTTMLAHRADAAVFGAGHPSEDEVTEYWKIVDSSLEDITGSVGFWKRQQARFSPRSLLADGRAALRRREQRGSVPGSEPRTSVSVLSKLKSLFKKGGSGE
ncbi:transglutaminaseTgpA domain-containing protein [Paenarthrobacter ureafaciens]|uniref:transglutaminase family protein n=1 Tax=Paenarthrobacter ureafaciens TaxID=37931 RepID=UPI0014086E10|nr:transglutaminase domain-containing protein [Paenarthrobacter ureafaciens]MCX8456249.1 transglutaminaseTgpA domain-containing protein [Paenarthrobacter ureafaciens]MCY0972044.1 transglutaminaseTgpA domain-containing protein [Paenarthrobacter ureafaciens]